MRNLNSIQKFSLAVLTFVVLLTIAVWLIRPDLSSSWTLIIALQPMIAGVFVLMAVVSAIRSMDEMQRAIQLEALAIAVGGMFMVFIAQITLDMAGRPIAINPGNNLIIMDALYLAGFLLGRRRYA